MNVLCFNPGSGTLRYRLFDMNDEVELVGGMADRIQGAAEVSEAALQILEDLSRHTIDAIIIRVVHGGEEYIDPTVVSDDLTSYLRNIQHLAPLHLPTAIAVIDSVRHCSECDVFAAFDTAFHRSLPDSSRYYPLPDGLRDKYRRFGFHGFAHQSVSENFRSHPSRVEHHGSTDRIISVHFGGGASVCAIREGRSIATTMGMTPLDGLMMSTRCGHIDPGIILALLREGQSVDEVDDLLNRQSGLLGVSGVSNDTRDILPAMKAGDASAKLAIDMYADRVRQAIGAYIAVLSGVDAVLISGALVKESPIFRSCVLDGLRCFGLRLDADENDRDGELAMPTRLNRTGATIAFFPATEELSMARAVMALRRTSPKTEKNRG